MSSTPAPAPDAATTDAERALRQALIRLAARVLQLRTEGNRLNTSESKRLDEFLCLLAIDMRKIADGQNDLRAAGTEP